MTEVRRGVALPILGGRLRGMKWLPASGGKVVRVLGGSYEPEQTALFETRVQPGATVLDIGAHVGYYTLLSAALAGERGAVWAFEPHPRNCAWLRGHIALNGLANVRIEEAALGAHEGTTRFVEGTGSGTGHVAAEGGFEVRVHRLDDFCREHDITPDIMKLDVEGAEADVLEAATDVLTRARPVLFLSTHGEDVHRRCLSLLERLDYRFSPILGDDIHRTSEVLCEPLAS